MNRWIALTLLAASSGFAQDWPQWRGPHRDGTLTAEPKAWPEKLSLKWKIAVGEGHATPVFAGGRIFVFSREEGQEVLRGVDPRQGTVAWKKTYPAPYKMNPAATAHGEGPKSTPLVQDGKVYTLGINGILSSWDAASGKLRWQKEFSKDFKRTSPLYGNAMSPMIEGGLLIAHVGGNDDGALMAFDPDSGEVRWKWNGDGPAYASPIAVTLGGVRQIVTQSQYNIVAVEAATGKLLWKIPFKTEYVQNIVTPLVYRDTLILGGVFKPTMAVRDAETVWKNEEVSMYMSSPVLAGDLVFAFSHKNKGQFVCLDARTGATRWKSEPRQGDNSSVQLGPRSLLLLKDDGELLVAKPSGTAFEVLHHYTVADSPTWAHPIVMSDGLLIKDLKSLALWSVQ